MEKKRIFVLPGEIAVTKQLPIISTLLGSCVAICLFNKKIKAGGMNHYMLPSGTNTTMAAKYGDYATKKLVSSMLRIDANKTNLEANVFGGAAVVGHLNSGFEIGQRNADIALTMLKEQNIKIVQKQLGGENGVKIFFDNQTGLVEVRLIKNLS